MRGTLHALLLIWLAVALLTGCGNQIGYDDDVFPDDDSAADDDDDTADDDTGDDDTTAASGANMLVDPPQVIEYGSLCLNTPTTEQVAIVNIGDGPLTITEMVCNVPIISFTPFTGTLTPGSAPVILDLTATCTAAESFNAPLKILSNDPTNPVYNVYLVIDCISC
ncbi:MAG: hypothetical protein QGH45_23625 [Myxococcota bacterium]|jgi:hypothetical protein|nr:hypothetical protein [Myxococcota bacterium]